MKYVIIPADVHLVNRLTKKPVLINIDGEGAKPWVFTHKDFVMGPLLSQAEMTKGGPEALRRVIKLEKAFGECKPGDIIGVEDADYRAARAAMNTFEWTPEFASYAPQILPHIEAWEDAEKQNDDWMKQRRIIEREAELGRRAAEPAQAS